MEAVHSWFHTSLFKPVGFQPAGPLILEDNIYQVETILQISKHGAYIKIKYIGYSSSHNQCIKLSELKETALEVVKTFLGGRSDI